MKCLVTGAAGFIGSHLCERLLQGGHTVTGIDALIPYYDPAIKKDNLAELQRNGAFTLHTMDMRKDPLEPLLEDVEVVFHLAAMPGLLRSWTDFDLYESCNVTATQRLLQAASQHSGLQRFIYASTSSVYGRYGSGDESLPLRPVSPYGVTKMAAENLCRAFEYEKGLPLVVLRYFSVYGPRQRPDMAYHRFIHALLSQQPVIVYGDGHQVRGNTYVTDCAEATVAAVQALPGETYNVGGGEAITIWDVLHKLEILTGRKAAVRCEAIRPGDQRYTFADTQKLYRHLGWKPRIGLDEGLYRQVAWQRAMFRAAA